MWRKVKNMKLIYLIISIVTMSLIHISFAQLVSTTDIPSQGMFRTGLTGSTTPSTMTPSQGNFQMGIPISTSKQTTQINTNLTPISCSDLRTCVKTCTQIQNCSMYLNCIEICVMNATNGHNTIPVKTTGGPRVYKWSIPFFPFYTFTPYPLE